jgi:hypothetical protein
VERKLVKKSLAIYIVLIFFLHSVPQGWVTPIQNVSAAGTQTIFESNTNVPAGYIGIYTIEDLDNVRNDLSGKYILMNDIDLSTATAVGGEYFNNGAGWQPIGTEISPFTGIFDGNGHKVIGMKIHLISDKKVYAGLFGSIKDAQIKNIGILDSVVYAESTSTDSSVSDVFAGGVVGYAYNFTVSNSYNTGSVTAFSLFKSDAGGIVGKAEANFTQPSTIINSYNTSQVNAKTAAGGVAGETSRVDITKSFNNGNINFSNSSNKYSGGIVGYDYRSTISESYNTGTVNFGTNGGGIIGYSSYTTLKNSYNEGTIASTASFSKGGGIAGYAYHSNISDSNNKGTINLPVNFASGGGIIGEAMSDTSVVRSFNLGEIIADTSGGGIVGDMYSSTVAQSFNAGAVNKRVSFSGGIGGYISDSTISDSYNISDISGKYDTGGIAGNSSNTTIRNTYNLGSVNVASGTSAGGIAGEFQGSILNSYYLDSKDKGVGTGLDDGTMKKTLEELQSVSAFQGFDFSSVWTMEGNSGYLFPELINPSYTEVERVKTILLKTLPQKTTYIQGEDFDVTGAIIMAISNYFNKNDLNLNPEMISGFDKNQVGIQNVKITYEGVAASFNVTVVEKDVTPPSKPIVNEVTENSIAVSGTAEVGSLIEVRANISLIGSAATRQDGSFNATINEQASGTKLFVTATDKSGNESDPVKVVVKDITAPAKPFVHELTERDIIITGEA